MKKYVMWVKFEADDDSLAAEAEGVVEETLHLGFSEPEIRNVEAYLVGKRQRPSIGEES